MLSILLMCVLSGLSTTYINPGCKSCKNNITNSIPKGKAGLISNDSFTLNVEKIKKINEIPANVVNDEYKINTTFF